VDLDVDAENDLLPNRHGRAGYFRDRSGRGTPLYLKLMASYMFVVDLVLFPAFF
jgi:hypothetical protein